MRVLVVEDDPILGHNLQAALAECKYTVQWAKDGALAKSAMATTTFDIIVLDIGLPKISGIELLKYLHHEENPNKTVPVLILSARHEIADRIKGLDAGADDYLPKPFDLHELEARLRALYRRRYGISSNVVTRDNIVLDIAANQVTLNSILVPLTPHEFAIFRKFLENQGRILCKETLLRLCPDPDAIDSNVIEVHVYNLRKKFGKNLIHTIRGVGYIINRQI